MSIREGDLVFQDLACGERCQLIRDITDGPYSHVGVVQEENGERVLGEAYGPVGTTPLSEWVWPWISCAAPASNVGGRAPSRIAMKICCTCG